MIEQILNGEALSSIRTKLNEVINLVNTPVLESLPSVDASKAGRKFWLNGTLWTYAKEGQFGSLAVGTPWPVKGYREIYAILNQSGTNTPTLDKTLINEIGEFALSRESEGNYKLTLDNAFPVSKTITYITAPVPPGFGSLPPRRILSGTVFGGNDIQIRCERLESATSPQSVDIDQEFSIYIRVQA